MSESTSETDRVNDLEAAYIAAIDEAVAMESEEQASAFDRITSALADHLARTGQ